MMFKRFFPKVLPLAAVLILGICLWQWSGWHYKPADLRRDLVSVLFGMGVAAWLFWLATQGRDAKIARARSSESSVGDTAQPMPGFLDIQGAELALPVARKLKQLAHALRLARISRLHSYVQSYATKSVADASVTP